MIYTPDFGPYNHDIRIHDFSKAFDTVPYDKLLYKLKYYEIIMRYIRLDICIPKTKGTESYSGGTRFNWVHVYSGIPQGTVVGPLLFLLYINDLLKYISKQSTVLLFADDCIIYSKVKQGKDNSSSD